jgi:hypothetical protein
LCSRIDEKMMTSVLFCALLLLLRACTEALEPEQTSVDPTQAAALSQVLTGMGLPAGVMHLGLPIATTCWNARVYWERTTYASEQTAINTTFVADSWNNELLGFDACHGGRPGSCSTFYDSVLTGQTESRHNGLCCQADGIVRMLYG